MKLKKLAALSVFASFILGPASAQEVGTVDAVHGQDGEVFVMRGSKAFVLKKGDPLLVNDRLVTKGSGRVTVQAYGCSRSLPSGAMLNVNGTFCTATPVSLTGATTASATPALAVPALGGVTAAKVAVAGTILSTPAIVGSAAGDNDEGEPVSP